MKTLYSHIYNSYIIDPLALESMNYYGKHSIPFLFIIDFLANEPYIAPLQEVNKSILYSINGFSNYTTCTTTRPSFFLNKYPVAYLEFKEAFDTVYAHLVAGDSYLLNLTFPTPIDTNLSLYQIFLYSNAPYKLYYNDQFVVFSPEPFVTIKDGNIYTFPMKGTIDATIKHAKEMLINDQKEYAEHITVVDLLRNDLARVSHSIAVTSFRYIQEVKTHSKTLLQTSSTIQGTLYPNYKENLGTIFASLLPAGSVTGAPKKKTVEIIQQAENYTRGYYTGIFGYFDGKNVESAVMIRFIEKINNTLVFKSGGGITVYSNPIDEYNEMVQKVYVPIN